MKPRVLYIVTSPLSLLLLRGQARFLREHGFEVRIVTSPGSEVAAFVREEQVEVVTVAMQREISPLRDVVALWRLRREIRRFRPDILNAGTPKAGLLGGIAGKLAGVPIRIYTLRGLRLETARGWRRGLLRAAERVAAGCAQRVICVSGSLRDQALALRLMAPAKAAVLASGSSNGVDAEAFAPTAERREAAARLRADLGIPAAAPVVGFVGRFTRDKGLPELVEAFHSLGARFPELRLLLVGFFEPGDPVSGELRRQIETHPRIIVRAAEAPALYYHVMDVVALPTHREGFPNVALEAAAAAKPIVGARATGVVDAVVDGATGLLTPLGDAAALAAATAQLLADRTLRERMGQAAQERVRREFPRARVAQAWCAEYQRLLAARPARGWYVRFFKRALDIAMSASALLLLSPLLLLVAVLVRLRLGTPVLFRQERPGLRGEVFEVIKFRSMTDARDPAGHLLPDAERMPRLGRFLRAASLDELPELWNVLRGEMSLVGPRPLLKEYLPRYTPQQARRHELRPGITGWAQVHGRQDIPFSRRLELDVWYVDHCRFWLDVRILLRTLKGVFRGAGVRSGQHVAEVDDLGLHPGVGNRSGES